LFDDESDFKYDFDLSPIMCTLLGEYDEDDLERPNLASIIQFAKELCDSPIDYDWNLARREFRDRSPLYLDILAIFKQAGKTTGARLGAFYNLMNLGDALQCWSPLQWAAYTDCTPEFVMLIENGANAFELTPSLRNIIHQATEPGTQGALAYLIEHNYHHRGVDINLKDRWGETPLHIACERSSISASMLLQQGANSKIRQEDGQVPLHYVKRLNHQDCINCAKILLEIEDPPINWQDSSGKTPLFYVLGIPECVDLFVKSGADIGLLDNQGMSVLHHACIENGHEALKILLRNLPNDASATVDELGRTPLQLCFDLYRPIDTT
jgi:ankyrin repeat protein